MHVQPASPGGPPPPRGEHRVAPSAAAHATLTVESIGYRVPRSDFAGHVDSVHAQACNLACNGTLLTLAASGAGDGPTMLLLARGAPNDLRNLFEVGERIHCRRYSVRTGRAEFCLSHARVWRPADPGRWLAREQIEASLRHAQLSLAQRRRTHPSVLDASAAPVAAALGAACRALDRETAVRHVARLIGWGEGLTPAGDDFLVGLIAGLDALVGESEPRRRFRGALAAAFTASTQRTTPIAAHYLRLAADGHYAEPLLRLRNALLCEVADGAVLCDVRADALLGEGQRDAVDAALQRALAVGATSGADAASGLLAGLLAWLPSCEAAR